MVNNSSAKNNININQVNNNEQNKKIKRLEASCYRDKPLTYIAENFGELGKDQGACGYVQKILNENPIFYIDQYAKNALIV